MCSSYVFYFTSIPSERLSQTKCLLKHLPLSRESNNNVRIRYFTYIVIKSDAMHRLCNLLLRYIMLSAVAPGQFKTTAIWNQTQSSSPLFGHRTPCVLPRQPFDIRLSNNLHHHIEYNRASCCVLPSGWAGRSLHCSTFPSS